MFRSKQQFAAFNTTTILDHCELRPSLNACYNIPIVLYRLLSDLGKVIDLAGRTSPYFASLATRMLSPPLLAQARRDVVAAPTCLPRWITYCDAQTYINIVFAGPLLSLASPLLYGLIHAQNAEHLVDDPNHDFTAEVPSYFCSGTQLQEVYIAPSLLPDSDWDVLAKRSDWSQSNASMLHDTHWVEWAPGEEELHGWVSLTARNRILVLRNVSSRPQAISTDMQDALELPPDARRTYTMHSPRKNHISKAAVTLRTVQANTSELQPFEVLRVARCNAHSQLREELG
jgi:hypothetical protein